MATLATTLRTARAQAIVTAVGSNGKVKIYAGGTGGTLLGTLTCSATFGTVSNGVLTANAITQDSAADAGGVADTYTITTSADVVQVTGTVSEAGGGGELIMNETTVVQNGTLSVTSLVLTEAA